MALPTTAAGRSHENKFGLLRLLLGILAIVSHAPELTDVHRERTLLTRLFGTLSFGELAVDGFFIISGYLITLERPAMARRWRRPRPTPLART